MNMNVDIQHELVVLRQFLARTAPLPQTGTLGPLRAEADALYKKLRAPVRVCIAGEFSSGKSTLTNILVGEDLIPTSVLASDLPPLIFRYGKTRGAAAGWWDKTDRITQEDIDFDELMTHDPDFIVLHSPNPLLKKISIFDTPGTSDPTHDSERMQLMAERADALIWCTNAVQAWRESERHTWSGLSDDIRANGLMVVTHVDLPAIRRGYDRVMTRLHKEVDSYFKAIIPLAGPKAMAAIKDGIVLDSDEWKASGGATLMSGITSVAQSLRETDLQKAKALIAEKIEPYFVETNRSDDEPSKPKDADSTNVILQLWGDNVDALLALKDSDTEIGTAEFIQQVSDMLIEFAEYLSEQDAFKQEFDWFESQFQDALYLLILLQLEIGTGPMEDAATLLLQLGRDLSWVASNAD